MAKSLVTTFSDEIVTVLAKKVNTKIDHICSTKTDTILTKHCDEVTFSWDNVWSELQQQLPTLLSLLLKVLYDHSNDFKTMIPKHGICSRNHLCNLIWE